MKKTFLILLISFIQNLLFAKDNSFFSGVYYNGNQALYGMVNLNEGLNGKKVYIFKKVADKLDSYTLYTPDPQSSSYGIYIYDTIRCNSFFVLVPIERIDIVICTDNNSDAMSIAPPLNKNEDKYQDYLKTKDQHIVSKFIENQIYSYKDIQYNLVILDEFVPSYGKKELVNLSGATYDKLVKRDKNNKFSSFLSEADIHPFEKMVLFQNQMNLFLPENDLRIAYGVGYDGDPNPPLWEPPVYCNKVKLMEIVKTMNSIWAVNCDKNWDDFYDCMRLNNNLKTYFDSLVHAIYPEWIDYYKSCIEAKQKYEAEECKCQRFVQIYDGEMGYIEKSSNNFSLFGIMPNDFRNYILNINPNGGGFHHPWMSWDDIGYNEFNNSSSLGTNISFSHAGNDQGLGGWNSFMTFVPYGSCSGYFNPKFAVGDTLHGSSPIYFENNIFYSCVNSTTELSDNCKCPITVNIDLRHSVSFHNKADGQKGCNPFIGGSHAGKLNELSVATLRIDNRDNQTSTIKLLDAGQALTYAQARRTINFKFYYDLASLAQRTAQFIASSRSLGSALLDTTLLSLIRSGITLAGTKPNYDTVITSTGNYMLINHQSSFLLYPNNEAVLRIDHFYKGELSGVDAGYTQLVDEKKFLMAFYGDAHKGNQCCNPAFMTSTNIGMGSEQKNIFNKIHIKGGNKSPYRYVDNFLWGAYYYDYCGDTGTYIEYGDKMVKANDNQPDIRFSKGELTFNRFDIGSYDIIISNSIGQILYQKSLKINNNNLQSLSTNLKPFKDEMVIINIKGQNYTITKKYFNYE